MQKQPFGAGAARAAMLVALACAALPAHAVLEYDEYLERAQKARQRGDWQDVAVNVAEAINHPDRPRKPGEWSDLNLDYGRAMGVLCQFNEAQMFLQRGLDIAQRGQASTARALYELGSLAAAEQKHALAAMHLTALLHAPAKADLAQLSALQWADARRKLAASLTALGKAEDAARWLGDGASSSPAGSAGITPYGTRCTAR
ncbi:MAG: hypothetical protein JNK75_13930 [Betaproteobacteria bacterium]|nr:hypothetical protein [Betaproteobacteria bacterium]